MYVDNTLIKIFQHHEQQGEAYLDRQPMNVFASINDGYLILTPIIILVLYTQKVISKSIDLSDLKLVCHVTVISKM